MSTLARAKSLHVRLRSRLKTSGMQVHGPRERALRVEFEVEGIGKKVSLAEVSTIGTRGG